MPVDLKKNKFAPAGVQAGSSSRTFHSEEAKFNQKTIPLEMQTLTLTSYSMIVGNNYLMINFNQLFKQDRMSFILTFSNRSVKLFTLKNHFLITAKALHSIRMCLSVQVNSLTDLFENIKIDDVLSFLRETELYQK